MKRLVYTIHFAGFDTVLESENGIQLRFSDSFKRSGKIRTAIFGSSEFDAELYYERIIFTRRSGGRIFIIGLMNEWPAFSVCVKKLVSSRASPSVFGC